MAAATAAISDTILGDGLSISTVQGTVITIRGDVLTAPGRQFPVTNERQELFAYISDGTLLVAQGKRYDPRVESFLSNISLKGSKPQRFLEVQISELKRVYQSARETAVNTKVATADDDLDPKMKRNTIELIGRAAAIEASDIHITADDKGAKIEMRIDGIIVQIGEVGIEYARQMMQAAYAMGTSSDTNYNPYAFQPGAIVDTDGRIGLPAAVQSIRLQWNPLMLNGRHLAMRLHHTHAHVSSDLVGLGYTPSQLEVIRELRLRPNGIVIVSGPTGSGKTTTLKMMLANLLIERRREINIMTVEDPAENYIDGLKQTQVMNATTAEDRQAKFTMAVNALLRSDPDSLMIGEVRDLESAKLAYAAALTGHGVWTSLHANTAIGIVTRLLDIGLEPYKVADHETFIGLIGQRLVRRLCPHCKLPLEKAVEAGSISPAVARLTKKYFETVGLDISNVYGRNYNGCEVCKKKKGIAGRTVVAEVIAPDEEFMTLCRSHNKSGARKYWVSALGGHTMLTHAVAKMALGMVSPEDVSYMVNTIVPDESSALVRKIMEEIRLDK